MDAARGTDGYLGLNALPRTVPVGCGQTGGSDPSYVAWAANWSPPVSWRGLPSRIDA